MQPIQTLDQAQHSHRAAWDIQLPPSSLHSTHTRPIGTELKLNQVNALLRRLPDRPCCCTPGTWLGPQECTVTIASSSKCLIAKFHCFSQAGSGGSLRLYPFYGVRLEKKVLAQLVLWICYFHSLLDMVQTDQCIVFSHSL